MTAMAVTVASMATYDQSAWSQFGCVGSVAAAIVLPLLVEVKEVEGSSGLKKPNRTNQAWTGCIMETPTNTRTTESEKIASSKGSNKRCVCSQV